MPDRPNPDQQNEFTLLLAMLALFLFSSPFTLWWASGDYPWFLPYLLWLLIILLGALLSNRHRRHDL
ncbi:MAG: UTP--glucose-1-phosphate uridylyltransferase [Gammaproteobacteria bacterium]|nr:UTP--glucose-1-phosphate uridylyltransferase [Gammaproteobacteria bacterium]